MPWRLRPKSNLSIAATGSTENRNAFDEYLRGRYDVYQRNLASLQSAAAHFQNAIRFDPNFALAYAALAESYSVLASVAPQAESARLLAIADEAARNAIRQAVRQLTGSAEERALQALLTHPGADHGSDLRDPFVQAFRRPPSFPLDRV